MPQLLEIPKGGSPHDSSLNHFNLCLSVCLSVCLCVKVQRTGFSKKGSRLCGQGRKSWY